MGKVLEGLSKGGGKLIGKALGSEATTKLKTNISKAIASVIKNPENAAIAKAIIKNMGKEAAEEYFQFAIDPIIQNISFDGTDYTAKEIIENAFSPDAIHAAWLGALSSGTSQMTGLAVNGVASKLTGKGGLLNEQNLNKLTDAESKQVNRALTNAYAGMLENEGYRNIDEYRKQADKTNANKKTAVAHALAVGHELSQAINNRIGQVGEKAAQIGNQSGSIKANQGMVENRKKDSSLELRQGLKTEGDAAIPTQSIEAETQTQQDSAELLKREEETGRIKAEEANVYSEEEKARYEKEAEPLFPMRTIDKTKDTQTVNRAKEIRTSLPSKLKKAGNLGYAQVDIEGLGQQEYYAHSRIDRDSYTENLKKKYPYITIDPDKPIFEAIKVGKENIIGGEKSYRRVSDTEYKILNRIAEQLGDHYDAEGTIMLFTERRPCPSCARNINQFQQRFPNIKIFIVHNEGINLLEEE